MFFDTLIKMLMDNIIVVLIIAMIITIVKIIDEKKPKGKKQLKNVNKTVIRDSNDFSKPTNDKNEIQNEQQYYKPMFEFGKRKNESKNYIEEENEEEEELENLINYPELWMKKIMSGAELTFFKELKKTLPSNINILAKVKIDDLIGCKRNQQIFRNRIKSRHFDFVIHQDEKNEILCVIELDDKTHENEKQIKIDSFKNELCKRSKIKILRFKPFEKISNKNVEEILDYKTF